MGVLNFRLSGSFSNEGQSSLLYSRHIKMLPDVGMVKTYPKCPEAGMNVDLGCYNVMNNIPFLVPEVFYWSIFNATATTYVFRDTVRHSYISTSFVKMLLLPLFLFFYRVQAACEMNTRTNMTVSDVMEAHATVLN